MGDTAVHTDKGTRHGHVRQSVTITSSAGLKLSLTNGRGSWVVGRGYKSWVVGVGVGVGVGVRVSNK